ncbi:hypothetical protein [Deinococcus sp. UYEF24]
MIYPFVHAQRPQFPLGVLFLGRTDALEDACPLSDGGYDRERIPLVASQTEGASRWLDVDTGTAQLTVEYRPSHGFGVTSDTHSSFGEGPHETYAEVDAVFLRVSDLIRRDEPTLPHGHTRPH